MSRFIRLACVGLIALMMLRVVLRAPGIWTVGLAIVFAALSLRGLWEFTQVRHSLARNYPLIWVIRYLFESIQPQIRQYLIESDTDGVPFDRDQRSLGYQRAKHPIDLTPFGTERDVKAVGFEWINPSNRPALTQGGICELRLAESSGPSLIRLQTLCRTPLGVARAV